MKFGTIMDGVVQNTEIQYSLSEKAFDCEPIVNADIYFAIGYLNLGIDSEDMLVKSLWGVSPREQWIEEDLVVPCAIEGRVRLLGEHESGWTRRIDNTVWRSHYDKHTGWFCLGVTENDDGDVAIKAFKNMIIVVDKERKLKSFWIYPVLTD